jgi:hypothetical protein
MIVERCCLALVAATITLAAPRAEDIHRGTGLICDTVEQIDEFIKADDAGEDAMQTVNATAMVCGRGQVAYVKGQKLKEVATKHGVLEVVEITVVGIAFNGRFGPIAPFKQVAVFLAKGENA